MDVSALVTACAITRVLGCADIKPALVLEGGFVPKYIQTYAIVLVKACVQVTACANTAVGVLVR
jgi:hypothetical protein